MTSSQDIIYKFTSTSRNYDTWNVTSVSDTNADINTNINPIQHKLLHQDIFTIGADNTVVFKERPIETHKISGILILEENRTFGRTSNKKRLLYKCIPYDKNLPVFLVPYEISMGFSKDIKNKYVVFQYVAWDSAHPTGLLHEVLGDVDDLSAYYEYQLYNNGLQHSIADFSKNAYRRIKEHGGNVNTIMNNIAKTQQVQDRTNTHSVYCIDPEGSHDFDDGFSLLETDTHVTISIYIANVIIWLNYLDLWSELTDRVSTIYLPDKKRPMLPTLMSDNICSLLEKTHRFAFVMDFVFEKGADGTISNQYQYNYTSVLIHVHKNYTYENCLGNKTVQRFLEITREIDVSNRNTYDNPDQSTHQLIAYWMIQMNTKCAEYLHSKKQGIFRSCTNSTNKIIDPKNDTIHNQILRWRQLNAQYMLYNENMDMSHSMLDAQYYIHITSPIRRLVDIVNQIIISDTANLNAREFCQRWTENICDINTQTKSIRKVQTDCELLMRCITNPVMIQIPHKGIIFDPVVSNKNADQIKYSVYLFEIHMFLKVIVSRDAILDETKEYKFKMFLFQKEDQSNKKIRLTLLM